LAHTGITVNTVSPGIIVTLALDSSFTMFQERRWGTQDWAELKTVLLWSSPLNTVGRLGTIEEIGKFLPSLPALPVSMVATCGLMAVL